MTFESYGRQNNGDTYYKDLAIDIFQEVVDEFDLYRDASMSGKDAYNIFRFKENKIRFWVNVRSKDLYSDIREYVDTNIVPRLCNMGCHLEHEALTTSYDLYYFNLDVLFPI